MPNLKTTSIWLPHPLFATVVPTMFVGLISQLALMPMTKRDIFLEQRWSVPIWLVEWLGMLALILLASQHLERWYRNTHPSQCDQQHQTENQQKGHPQSPSNPAGTQNRNHLLGMRVLVFRVILIGLLFPFWGAFLTDDASGPDRLSGRDVLLWGGGPFLLLWTGVWLLMRLEGYA